MTGPFRWFIKNIMPGSQERIRYGENINRPSSEELNTIVNKLRKWGYKDPRLKRVRGAKTLQVGHEPKNIVAIPVESIKGYDIYKDHINISAGHMTITFRPNYIDITEYPYWSTTFKAFGVK